MSFEINVIGTGSRGNAVQINRRILIDCGLPFKQLSPIARDLQLVLLTHRHGDHFREASVRRLAEERPTLRWGMGEWMLPLVKDIINPRQIDVLMMETVYHYASFDVKPIPLFHDVPNFGYRIFPKSGERLFYATDTGTLDGIRAKGYDLYMIEANHDTEELERRAKEKRERGEYAYEERAASNHLSKQQADAWLVDNIEDLSEVIYLHQHTQ